MMDKKQKKILWILIESFKAKYKDISANTYLVYEIGLEDIPANVLEAGVKRVIRECTFFPAIAEIREKCTSFRNEIEGKKPKSADEAWGELMGEMKRVGYMGKPVFSTPEIDLTVKRLGWLELNATEQKDLSIVRSQFRKAYENCIANKRETSINVDAFKSFENTGNLKIDNKFKELVSSVTLPELEAKKDE